MGVSELKLARLALPGRADISFFVVVFEVPNTISATLNILFGVGIRALALAYVVGIIVASLLLSTPRAGLVRIPRMPLTWPWPWS